MVIQEEMTIDGVISRVMFIQSDELKASQILDSHVGG